MAWVITLVDMACTTITILTIMVLIELFMVLDQMEEVIMVQKALEQKRVRLTFLNEKQETTIGNHQDRLHLLEEVEEVVDLDTENNYEAY